MTDYLEKAVEAAREAEQRVRSTWPPPSPARVLTAILRAGEPFIAQHHRADERARVEERLGLIWKLDQGDQEPAPEEESA